MCINPNIVQLTVFTPRSRLCLFFFLLMQGRQSLGLWRRNVQTCGLVLPVQPIRSSEKRCIAAEKGEGVIVARTEVLLLHVFSTSDVCCLSRWDVFLWLYYLGL